MRIIAHWLFPSFLIFSFLCLDGLRWSIDKMQIRCHRLHKLMVVALDSILSLLCVYSLWNFNALSCSQRSYPIYVRTSLHQPKFLPHTQSCKKLCQIKCLPGFPSLFFADNCQLGDSRTSSLVGLLRDVLKILQNAPGLLYMLLRKYVCCLAWFAHHQSGLRNQSSQDNLGSQ